MGILRRLREWREDKDGTLIGPDIEADSVDAGSVKTEGVDYKGLTPDYPVSGNFGIKEDSDQTTTSTNYTPTLDSKGVFIVGDIPQNATLYGYFIAQLKISDANETVFARPDFTNEDGGGVGLDELEVSHTGDTDETIVKSGWIEITTGFPGDLLTGNTVQVKVTGGTGTITYDRTSILFAGVEP